MKPDEIEVGKEYVLRDDYDYWCIDLQRQVRICSGQKIVVKISCTHLNQVFFGNLIDSQGEIEFGPDAVISEYDKSKDQTIPSLLIPFEWDIITKKEE